MCRVVGSEVEHGAEGEGRERCLGLGIVEKVEGASKERGSVETKVFVGGLALSEWQGRILGLTRLIGVVGKGMGVGARCHGRWLRFTHDHFNGSGIKVNAPRPGREMGASVGPVKSKHGNPFNRFVKW